MSLFYNFEDTPGPPAPPTPPVISIVLHHAKDAGKFFLEVIVYNCFKKCMNFILQISVTLIYFKNFLLNIKNLENVMEVTLFLNVEFFTDRFYQ